VVLATDLVVSFRSLPGHRYRDAPTHRV